MPAVPVLHRVGDGEVDSDFVLRDTDRGAEDGSGFDGRQHTLRVNPEISKALKTGKSQLIEELESWTKKSMIIQGDPALHWEQYDIY